MNANDKLFSNREAAFNPASTKPFPASKKIYVEGSQSDIRVPMREITVAANITREGIEEPNQPITVYDTSGPYSDPHAQPDMRRGLPGLRSGWIDQRGDTELLEDVSSEFGRERQQDPTTTHLRFEHTRQPRRALGDRNVTQMHYARQGMITPEMEFSAIRENQRQELITDPLLTSQHPGNSL